MKAMKKKSNDIVPFITDPKNYGTIFEIAALMIKNGLPSKFVNRVQDHAKQFEGSYDLMVLWNNETDQDERNEIIADLQEAIDDTDSYTTHAPKVRPKINFDNLENIAKDIVKFKKKLRSIIDQRSSIREISEKTGIPQASLYRFFNSASLPRKSTLYKIANAIDLDEEDIAIEWTK